MAIDDTAVNYPHTGSLQEGIGRMRRNGWAGLQTGALIGLGVAGALIGVDATLFDFLHSSPLTLAAETTALHAAGAGIFEGGNGLYRGIAGKPDEDALVAAAEAIDRDVEGVGRGIEHVGATIENSMPHGKDHTAYQFDRDVEPSAAIRDIIDRGPGASGTDIGRGA